jgi:TolA-binding protein
MKSQHLYYLTFLFLVGCSTAEKNPNKLDEPRSNNSELNEMRALVSSLKSRVESLEVRLDGNKDSKDSKDTSKISAAQAVRVAPPVSDQAGTPVEPKPIPTDAEPGFVNDAAVLAYRQALILYTAQKYPESALGFSGFLDNYPDHALAGSAQFYVGESYFKQRDYKRAITEYRHVLTSYDRSPHVADALHQLSSAEALMGNAEESQKQKQLLSRLFPQSPAAADAAAVTASPEFKPEPQREPDPVPQIETTKPQKSLGVDEPPATAPLGGT